jgi:tRNA threonylcarbamoyl adenosine modification protein YjeE
MASDPAPNVTSETIWTRTLQSEAETQALAREIMDFIEVGDLLTLSGDLGSGKTTFARALIRALTGVSDLEVPSPTFTLMQIYEAADFRIVHADLFRLNRPEDLIELGWDEAAEGALVLVEWPERAANLLNPDRLDLNFAMDFAQGPSVRTVTLTGFGGFAERLALSKAIRELFEQSGWTGATRQFMLGDASIRAYERLLKADGTRAILMISPARPDGPPIRYGKSYSTIAKLADNIRPFIAIDRGLRNLGFSAPEIYAVDTRTGLAIIEDLGNVGIASEDGIVQERYAWAVTAISILHGANTPDHLALPDDEIYRIPPYDLDALLIEVELLLEWYAPHIAKIHLASGAKAIFLNLWRQVLEEISSSQQVWTLRDYHSPNLLWLPHREGVARIGMIDFQDCVLGNPAYDVVSLLQDARVTVPPDVELKLLSHYARLRREADAGFDMAAFARAYAVLGAQRATKILGIFTRLDKRDHKSDYLVHLPRIEKYLAKDMSHPALAGLKLWYITHLPKLFAPPP